MELVSSQNKVVDGVALIGVFTPVGWYVEATTSAYYLVRIIVDELKED